MAISEPNIAHSGPVLDRMREVGRFRSDRALAKFIGIPQTTLSGWRRRGSIPIDLCVDFSGKLEVDLKWLLTGEGAPDQFDSFTLDQEWSLDKGILGVAIDWMDHSLISAIPQSPENYKTKAEILEDYYFRALHLCKRYESDSGISREDAIKKLHQRRRPGR